MSKSQTKLSKSQSVRQRITPTFVHQQIFNDYPCQQTKTRFTPTFASTVFDCEGYSIPTVHASKKIDPTPAIQTTATYKNVSKQRKQIEFSSCHFDNPYGSTQYGDLKDEMMLQTKDYGPNTSRMRKMVELMSNPIFGPPYIWQPQHHHKPQTADVYVKENYRPVGNERKEVIEQEKQDKGHTEQKKQESGDRGQDESKPVVKVTKVVEKTNNNAKNKPKKNVVANKPKTSNVTSKAGFKNQRK